MRMLSQAERACLVIGDISGYMGPLAGSKLEHAEDVPADLAGAFVRAMRPARRLNLP